MKKPANYTTLNKQEKREIREYYIKAQNNLCYWCNEDLNKPAPKRITDKKIDLTLFPENFLQYPIHLQHNHKTGMTEGAVHSYCNAVMWQYYAL